MAGPYPMLSRYRLLARLGSGGMAEVYLVLSEGPGGFNKLQVLKLMRSDLTDQERPDFLQMFQDEARLAARLNHPNIVQSHEVGAEDGQPFIVMEFLDGQPLNRVQQRARHLGGGFSLEMELFVLCQVLEGLDYAHRLTDYDGTPLHIVHRDVSPQNVFITYAGQTKLVDFGVAKTLESSRTRAGVVKGKVAYMPPEQVTAGPIDHRADLFSVGVLLWEAIAGQAMHAELSVYESLHRLVRGELPQIRDVAPEVPSELERIVKRALELDPARRYPDADSFRHELLSYLESSGKVRARNVGEAVAQLFARERSEISQVIRAAMSDSNQGLPAPPANLRVTRMVPLLNAGGARATPAGPAAPALRAENESPAHAWLESPTMLESTPAPLRRVEPPARKTRRYWLGALSVLVVLGVSSVVALMSGSSGARNFQKPEGDSAWNTKSDPKPPSQHAAEAVKVDISVDPKQAAILLDGRVLGTNPYRGHEPRDEREHTLLISAPGFRAHKQLVRLADDLSLQMQLEPAPNEPALSEGQSPTSPARSHSAHRSRSHETVDPAPRDPYVDLPPPRRAKSAAPELDTSDPWAAEPSR